MKKLKSTKNIPLKSIIRLYKKGYGYAKLSVIENNNYFIAAFTDPEFFPSVNDEDILEAYFWVENVASYEFFLKVIGRINVGPEILFFRHTDEIKRYEERKCLGVEINTPMKFFIFNPADMDKGVSSEKVVFHKGKVIWLEDREAVLKSRVKLNDGDYIKGNLRILNDDFEIIGNVKLIDSKKKIYNLIYKGMKEKERNRLLDYIFTLYRE